MRRILRLFTRVNLIQNLVRPSSYDLRFPKTGEGVNEVTDFL